VKIALVTGPCPPKVCGVGDYTRRLAEALRPLGVETEIISKGTWRVVEVSGLASSIDKLKPDIVHIQYPTSGFGHRLGPQLFAIKKRSVTTLHEASDSNILRKLSLLAFTVRPSRLIFTTECELQFARKWAPWISRVSSVIPIGSNIDAMPNSADRQIREVAYFGLIMPKKGLEDVFNLAKLIQSVGSQLKIRIIGAVHSRHQEYFEKLRLRSAQLPILWNTTVSTEEVAKQLSSCSVGYLPFPDGASERRASLKAMLANGVAVVTTYGASTPPSFAGVVRFANGIEEALGAIQQLLSDRSEQRQLRARAIEYMRQFCWERIAHLHLDVYEEVQAESVN
jgi:glycosyltransferase involved in cell wall biosynthesis